MELIRICIVEDQDLIRKSLQIVLDLEEDFQIVSTAVNGRVAIEKCQEHPPDIVLMDIHMPEMDGVEATKILKKRFPLVKVIILTTFEDIHFVVNAMQAGAEGYLLKAIDPQDLSTAIRLVHKGKTMIPQELAKEIFLSHVSLLHNNETSMQSFVPAGKKNLYDLIERELQVLQLISEGLQNWAIAEKLYISEGTVKNYVSSIYSKLHVRNRAAATKKAIDEGLL
ncbi:response regulator [Brevibacillus ginsengisoli]|uniref:response regulator n=1 Tax=Brevibacillus ginsengisoli TaxID=363854 RepID=UPI003CF7B5E6